MGVSDRYTVRLERLRRSMAEQCAGIGGLVVSAPTNVTYLTGFTGDSSALIVFEKSEVLVSDGRYAEQIERECPGLAMHIRPIGQPLYVGVGQLVARHAGTSMALEAAHLSVAEHARLCENSGNAAWKQALGWVEQLRMIKDDHEVAEIRGAIGLAEAAFLELKTALRKDRVEKELADHLEFAMRAQGAIGPAFPVILAVGPNAALPHYRPGTRSRVGDADFLLVDWGAQGPGGYRSDLTRMIVTGNVTDQFASVYRSVLDARNKAISAIRPGQSAREVNAVARASLKEAGLDEYFTHGLGHGFGLDIHEQPFLGRDPDLLLQPGMVVTVEPGVYRPGWGGIRIEDNVLVTADGAEILTSLPTELEQALCPL